MNDKLEQQSLAVLETIKELSTFPQIPQEVSENLRYAMINISEENKEIVDEMVKTAKRLMEVYKI